MSISDRARIWFCVAIIIVLISGCRTRDRNRAITATNHAVEQYDRGDYSAALYNLDEAISHDPEHFMAHYYRALILVEHYGSIDTAIQDLDIALALVPEHVESRYLLGKAHHLLGNLNASALEFERALALDGRHSGALFHLAAIREVTGDVEAAIQYYSLSIDVEPGEPQAYNRLAALLLRYERFDEAVAVLETGLGHTENPLLSNQLGQALRTNGQLEQAIVYLRNAVALEEGALGYIYDLGVTLYEYYRETGLASDREEAIRYLDMTQQRCTQNASGLQCEQITRLLNRVQSEVVEEVLPQ